ncbi:MAG: DUF202 domain-containing protein [Actinophytocola sp.]|uniref:YidH family protein n=1 Tax=Actinophytocola sp. TaxID=1872138 RepID=UPI001320C44D|nr:DUF202 domain-containing protein [Actinophytocola sp.]MPZ84302.1 DUF202 domain-containing protein [Actinophytocola sp.]
MADTESGQEPDYRFTLANERTFLAWIRTSLALVAAGVAVHQLFPSFSVHGLRTALACIALGATVAAGGYPHWRRIQRAMRHNAPLPRPRLAAILVTGVVVITAVCGVFVIVSSGR